MGNPFKSIGNAIKKGVETVTNGIKKIGEGIMNAIMPNSGGKFNENADVDCCAGPWMVAFDNNHAADGGSYHGLFDLGRIWTQDREYDIVSNGYGHHGYYTQGDMTEGDPTLRASWASAGLGKCAYFVHSGWNGSLAQTSFFKGRTSQSNVTGVVKIVTGYELPNKTVGYKSEIVANSAVTYDQLVNQGYAENTGGTCANYAPNMSTTRLANF